MQRARHLIHGLVLTAAVLGTACVPDMASPPGWGMAGAGAPVVSAGAERAVPATVTTDRRVALVIGNGAYRHTPPLDNPPRDARAMAETLQSLGFTLVGGRALLDLDRGGLESAIQQFGQTLRQGGGVGLVFYAGHGLQVNGKNYLVPVNAKVASVHEVRYQLVDAEAILEEMERSQNGLNIVILDACRNNPFAGRGFRSAEGGLAQLNAPTGTVIAYSTAPGRVATDGAGNNSPYTTALLAALRQPGLRLEDVFIQVRTAVERQTGGAQTPWESVSLRGAFYFNSSPAAPAAAPAPADRDTVFWQSIQGSSSRADFEAYLAQFPNGAYAALARNRIAALAAPQAPAQPTEAPGIEECDHLAASPEDRNRVVAGVASEALVPARAIPACRDAVARHPAVARFAYQLGRALAKNRDDAEAVRLYRLAADQGYALGQTALGWMYANGRGVQRDDSEAVRLYGVGSGYV